MSATMLSEETVQAVVFDELARIITLLDDGVDISARNERGETVFSFACVNNSMSAANMLNCRGANINTIDVDGGSLLEWAVWRSSPEFCAWLVSVGASAMTPVTNLGSGRGMTGTVTAILVPPPSVTSEVVIRTASIY
jgi:ankyrin repeat protein